MKHTKQKYKVEHSSTTATQNRYQQYHNLRNPPVPELPSHILLIVSAKINGNLRILVPPWCQPQSSLMNSRSKRLHAVITIITKMEQHIAIDDILQRFRSISVGKLPFHPVAWRAPVPQISKASTNKPQLIPSEGLGLIRRLDEKVPVLWCTRPSSTSSGFGSSIMGTMSFVRSLGCTGARRSLIALLKMVML